MDIVALILVSGGVGAVITKLGEKIVDKLMQTPAETKENMRHDIENLSQELQYLRAINQSLSGVVEQLQEIACYQPKCIMRISGAGDNNNNNNNNNNNYATEKNKIK